MTGVIMRGLKRHLGNALWVTALLPFALLVMLSVARSWRYPALWPDAWQFDAWRALGDDGAVLLGAALRSAALAMTVAVVATLIGMCASRAVVGHAHERRWMGLALLPFALPPAVFALALGQAYATLKLSGELIGVWLAQLPFATAYALLLCRGYWTGQRLALGDVALSLGARPLQVWWRVHWPLARGLLGICLFQTALMSWFDFALVRMVGAGQVETLTFMVFEYFGAGDLRQAAAAALVLLAPPCAALLWRPRLLWPALAGRPGP